MISGTVSEVNSLVGGNPGDNVSSGAFDNGIIPVSNGNYVVVSQLWNGNRGAVTWGNGSTGVTGTVSDANSLVGSNPDDLVGFSGSDAPNLILFINGSYVMNSGRVIDNCG